MFGLAGIKCDDNASRCSL